MISTGAFPHMFLLKTLKPEHLEENGTTMKKI